MCLAKALEVVPKDGLVRAGRQAPYKKPGASTKQGSAPKRQRALHRIGRRPCGSARPFAAHAVSPRLPVISGNRQYLDLQTVIYYHPARQKSCHPALSGTAGACNRPATAQRAAWSTGQTNA